MNLYKIIFCIIY